MWKYYATQSSSLSFTFLLSQLAALLIVNEAASENGLWTIHRHGVAFFRGRGVLPQGVSPTRRFAARHFTDTAFRCRRFADAALRRHSALPHAVNFADAAFRYRRFADARRFADVAFCRRCASPHAVSPTRRRFSDSSQIHTSSNLCSNLVE